MFMKRFGLWGLLCCFVMISAIGCEGKSSSLEGRVVDGKGRPLANVKVAAKKAQAIKGFEKSEAATGADGVFRFAKLSAESEYQLDFQSDLWTSEKKTVTDTAPEEQTKVLPEPIAIRYLVTKEGVLVDTATDLEWFAGPDKDTSWEQAQSWVAGLKAGKGGWRIPARKELTTLVTLGSGKMSIQPNIRFSGKYILVWSMQKGDPDSAWAFPFTLGASPEIILDESKSKRALAVRSRKR